MRIHPCLVSARRGLLALALSAIAGGELRAAAIDVSPTESTAQIINPLSGFFRWRGSPGNPGTGTYTPYISGNPPPPGHYALAGDWKVPVGDHTSPTGAKAVDHYNRFFWVDLEQTENNYNFQPIYDAIAAAKDPANGGPGSKFGFRVRTMRGREDSGTFVPQYLINRMALGWVRSGTKSDGTTFSTYVPDWNDADFISRHSALVLALAAEFDGHPDIAYIDIGPYGLYGEWHTYQLYSPASPTGAVAATTTTRRAYADSYINAFKRTRLVMMTDDESTLAYVLQKTPAEFTENSVTYKRPWVGWRRDSLANSHFDSVDDSLAASDKTLLYERYKKAPVITETYNSSGVTPSLVPVQVANWNISGLGNGNFNYSSGDLTTWLDAQKLMGYRFVLENVTVATAPSTGGTLAVSTRWKNKGSAMAHERVDLKFQLRSGSTVVWESPASSLSLASYARPAAQGGDVVGLLPAAENGNVATTVSDSFTLFGSVAAGTYTLAVVVKSTDGTRAPTKLAITTAQNSDGSYTIGSLSVTGSNVAPTITTQPANQTANLGANAAFSVVATGTPAPTYQWRKNGTAIGGATNATLTLTAVQASDAATYSVVVTNSAGSVTSSNAPLTVTSGAFGTFADIGGPTLAGSTSYSAGTYTINASGADIWGTSDQFHYHYSPLSGDAVMTARVTAVENTNAWAKAGVMIRETSASNSRWAYVYVTPANGVQFDYRATAGGTCTHAGFSAATITAPYWVKLVRSGNVFTGFMSSDGANWTQLGAPVTLSMGASTLAGLAVTAHTNTTLNTSTFTNVSLNTYVSVIDNFDDGNVTTPLWTTAAGTGGAVTISASTTDARADGSSHYATIGYNSAATWQHAVLDRGTATFGASWAANGVNAIRFWLKGATTNTISANNKVKVQIREGLEGERWSFDIGNAAKVGSWQQITVPFSALYYDGTINPTGTTGAFDLSLIDQLRFFNNDNGAAITIKVDRLEAIKQ